MVTHASCLVDRSPQREDLTLDRLLGRQVLDVNGHRAGRLEDVRVQIGTNGCTIAEYVIGAAGLLERLGLGVKLLFGRERGGHVARWDQLDISDPAHARLTCAVQELRRL